MAGRAKTPWHYWAVSIFAVLWMAMGAFDYVMTHSGSEWYLANFSEAERTLFTGFPAWVVAMWALSIWSGVAAAILMLFRHRWAVLLYAVSAFFFVTTAIHNYLIHDPAMHEVVGTLAVIFTFVIAASIGFLWWYSARAQRHGIIA